MLRVRRPSETQDQPQLRRCPSVWNLMNLASIEQLRLQLEAQIASHQKEASE